MDSIEAAGAVIPWSVEGMDSERNLIEEALKDPEAFVALYRAHYDYVASYLFRRTGHCHVTEDLLSDVFFAALKNLGRFRHRGIPFRFWLLGIATNLANQWARRNRRRPEPMEAAEGIVDPLQEHTAAVEDRDEQEAALRQLLALKPKHQAVLALHYLEGLSVEKVAEVLNCRPGTVKSRLSRARRELRRKLHTRR